MGEFVKWVELNLSALRHLCSLSRSGKTKLFCPLPFLNWHIVTSHIPTHSVVHLQFRCIYTCFNSLSDSAAWSFISICLHIQQVYLYVYISYSQCDIYNLYIFDLFLCVRKYHLRCKDGFLWIYWSSVKKGFCLFYKLRPWGRFKGQVEGLLFLQCIKPRLHALNALQAWAAVLDEVYHFDAWRISWRTEWNMLFMSTLHDQ